MVSTRVLSGPTVGELAPSWRLALDAQNKATKTLEAYLGSLDQFVRFLSSKGMPQQVAHVRRGHIEAYIAHVLSVAKPSTASVRYRALQQFFKWALKEGEISVAPMLNMKPPKVPEDPPTMLTEDQIRALFSLIRPRILV